ncbi:DUF1801 domain-containing protein [Nostocoides sp. Soil756]|uniref:iron chaperone n=1 Tax=Nostocoides sp. Soil756 TaxID=1736399 RepID=UPI0009E7586A|nr:DUF1801 domain-containing protein [Tetrasphaera sp. Soil756]
MSPTQRKTARSSEVLSEAEKAAMKETVAERRARAKGAKAEDDVAAVLAAIAKMTDDDRALCARLHEVITAAAPELAPRTWYGMPAYAKDGKVLLAVKNSGKFGMRYTSLEFQDVARLDDGSMWPVSWAVQQLTAAGEKQVADLVRRAVG